MSYEGSKGKMNFFEGVGFRKQKLQKGNTSWKSKELALVVWPCLQRAQLSTSS